MSIYYGSGSSYDVGFSDGSGYGCGEGCGDGFSGGTGSGKGSEYLAILDSIKRLQGGHLLTEPELDLLINLDLTDKLTRLAKFQLYSSRIDIELNKVLT